MTPEWDASLPQGYPSACFQVMGGADSVRIEGLAFTIKMSCLCDKQVNDPVY